MKNIHWFLVLFMGSLWGVTFPFTEVLLHTFNPHMIVLLRVLITTAVLGAVAVCMFRGRCIRHRCLFGVPSAQYGNLFVLSIFNVVLPFSFITYGQTFITGGLTAIFNATTAFFTIAVASVFIAEERFTSRRVIGVLTGIIGIVVVVGYRQLFSLSAESLGGMSVMLGALCYGIAATWTRTRLGEVPVIVSVFALYFYATVMMFAYIGVAGTFQFDLVTVRLFMAAFLYTLLSSIIAFPLLLYLIKQVGAGNVGISTMATAPAAIILGVVFLDEKILLSHIVGFAIIVLGLMIIDGRPIKWVRRA